MHTLRKAVHHGTKTKPHMACGHLFHFDLPPKKERSTPGPNEPHYTSNDINCAGNVNEAAHQACVQPNTLSQTVAHSVEAKPSEGRTHAEKQGFEDGMDDCATDIWAHQA